MDPGKHPKEEFIALGVRWTPGARKLVLYAVLTAAGGGVVAFWDQIAKVLSSAPVWAIMGVFALSSIFVTPPALAAVGPPDDMAVFCLETHYGQHRGILQ